MRVLRVSACAKINLGLWILGKRPDGYHEIATLFQQIDLKDEITVEKTPASIRITTDHPDLPSNEANLVFSAFRHFQNHVDLREGVRIHIVKRIPVGAGLGGGSSNAAATLLALNRLWNNPLSPETMNTVAAEIGSDVPFFLMGGTALGQGRGEKLTTLQGDRDYWIVLVFPGFSVSTSWAYREVKIALTKEEKFLNFRALFERFSPREMKRYLRNDLENVVFQRHPELRVIKQAFYSRDAFYAAMSGSGSSIFGCFDNREVAEKTRSFFAKRSGWQSYLCRPVSNCPSIQSL
jgi:4-diphosphocytidyl-2-C-methyl-D-erythritol kinase